MYDSRPPHDPGELWRGQASDGSSPGLTRMVDRRPDVMATSTRLDTLGSIGAVCLLIAILLSRPEFRSDRSVMGAVALSICWVFVTLVRFRRRIWPQDRPGSDFSLPGIQFYRAELERRREHLRSAWVWMGPLLLACLTLGLILLRKVVPTADRLLGTVPFVLVLLVWIMLTYRRRRQAAREIQNEIDRIREL